MDPTTGALGYGIEYGYSVMERLRLAALQGDAMTQQPMLVTPGEEAWKTKEAKVGEGVPESWGDWRRAGAELGSPDRRAAGAGRRRHRRAAASPLLGAAANDARRPAAGALKAEEKDHGTDWTSDLQAAAADELQGVRLPHLPGLCHEAGRQAGRAGRLPVRHRRGQGPTGGRLGPAHPAGDHRPARPASSKPATKRCSTGTRRRSITSRACSSAYRTPKPARPYCAGG